MRGARASDYGEGSVRRTAVAVGIVPAGLTIACTSTLSCTRAGTLTAAVLGSAPCTQNETVSGPGAGVRPLIRETRNVKAPAASVVAYTVLKTSRPCR